MGIDILPIMDQIEEEITCELGVLEILKADKRLNLPLKKVDIQAKIRGQLADVTLEQAFENPFEDHLEATYIFPLPGTATVRDFELRVGERIIQGQVQERSEARKTYQQALESGHRAGLVEQERDGVFTVQVGNLPPGETIGVRLTYSEKLPFFENGSSELRLPLVVAPRYIPGTPLDRIDVGQGVEVDTDQVPDASRISPPRLVPGQNSGVELAIEVQLAGNDIQGEPLSFEDLNCSQHATRTALGSEGVTVKLARIDEKLNRDFILRWTLADSKPTSSLLYYQSEEGPCYGMLTLLPPKQDVFLGVARDVIFVLDRSGSMGDTKMNAASQACGLLLNTLAPRDRFAILPFDHECSWWHPHPLEPETVFIAASDRGIAQGQTYLRTIQSRGGTELNGALQVAFQQARSDDDNGRIPVVVLLTDGQVGNESEILRTLQTQTGDSRIFTVGIDTAVNESFLKRLAHLGGGTSAFVIPGEGLDEALTQIGREIGTPLLTQLALEPVEGDLDESSLSPARLPDLFQGRSSTLYFTCSAPSPLTLTAHQANGDSYSEIVKANTVNMPALAQLWGKTRIADLEDQFRVNPQKRDGLKQAIIQLSIAHNILTRFTAYVAVDKAEVVNPDGKNRHMVQPVEQPDQWSESIGAPVAASAPMMHKKRAAAPGSPPPLAPAMPAPASLEALSDTALSAGAVFGEALLEEACEDLDNGMIYAEAPVPKMAPSGNFIARSINQVKGFFQPPMESAKTVPEARAKAKPGKPQAQKTPAETEIFSQLTELKQVLMELEKTLAQNQVPQATVLSEKRKALLKALTQSQQIERWAELQRYLRKTLFELLSAMQTEGITVPILEPLLKACIEAFPESPQPEQQAEFWEASI